MKIVFSGKKDQISGISWPYVGLEIVLIWSFFWKPAEAGSQQVFGGSLAATSLTDHRVFILFSYISMFIHDFKGIRNLKIPNLLAPVNWLISDVNLTFPYWCGAFYASAPYILYIHITNVVQHSAKTINKGGRIHCLKSLKSLHEMLYI